MTASADRTAVTAAGVRWAAGPGTEAHDPHRTRAGRSTPDGDRRGGGGSAVLGGRQPSAGAGGQERRRLGHARRADRPGGRVTGVRHGNSGEQRRRERDEPATVELGPHRRVRRPPVDGGQRVGRGRCRRWRGPRPPPWPRRRRWPATSSRSPTAWCGGSAAAPDDPSPQATNTGLSATKRTPPSGKSHDRSIDTWASEPNRRRRLEGAVDRRVRRHDSTAGPGQRSTPVEHVDPPTAHEHPVGPGEVVEHTGRPTPRPLPPAHPGRRRCRWRWRGGRIALDGQHPQAGRGQRRLDGDAAAAGAHVPEDAPIGEVEVAEHDRTHLGLGDHPGAVGERHVDALPAVRREPPAPPDGRGPPPTGGRRHRRPVKRCRRAGARLSSGSPSRVATTTSWWCAPWLISAAPTASGGAAGAAEHRRRGRGGHLGGRSGRRPVVAAGHRGVVPRQAEPGEGQGH